MPQTQFPSPMALKNVPKTYFYFLPPLVLKGIISYCNDSQISFLAFDCLCETLISYHSNDSSICSNTGCKILKVLIVGNLCNLVIRNSTRCYIPETTCRYKEQKLIGFGDDDYISIKLIPFCDLSSINKLHKCQICQKQPALSSTACTCPSFKHVEYSLYFSDNCVYVLSHLKSLVAPLVPMKPDDIELLPRTGRFAQISTIKGNIVGSVYSKR